MLAAGILAIGFMLIMTLWPAGMKMTAMSTERVIGQIVADEAFAKMRLYGFDAGSPNWPNDPNTQSVKYTAVAGLGFEHDNYEEARYPSTGVFSQDDKKYCWSALLRQVGPSSYQATVFVSRLADRGAKYPESSISPNSQWRPMPIAIGRDISDAILDDGMIGMDTSLVDEYLAKYVNDGSIIVDGQTGKIMRVMERDLYLLTLADKIDENMLGNEFWVVPSRYKAAGTPPKVGGRCPCISVFQRVIDF